MLYSISLKKMQCFFNVCESMEKMSVNLIIFKLQVSKIWKLRLLTTGFWHFSICHNKSCAFLFGGKNSELSF